MKPAARAATRRIESRRRALLAASPSIGASSLEPTLEMRRPLVERVALLLEVLVNVVGRDNAGLRVIQAALRDVRWNLQLSQTCADSAPQIMEDKILNT